MRLICPDEREFTTLFGPEIRDVWICSPWITSAGVDLLRKTLRRSKAVNLGRFELWVRLNAQDRLAGLTDYFAINQLLDWITREAGAPNVIIRTADQLHAKAIWTERGALIGSANLTNAGYSSNIEFAVRLEPDEARSQQSVRYLLENRMRIVSEAEWRDFLKNSESAGESMDLAKVIAEKPADEGNWREFVQQLVVRGKPSGGIR